MAKKDNNKQYLLIAVLAVVVYFAYSGGLFDGTSNDAPVVVEPVVGACGVEDVAFTPKITRLGKAGTSLSTVDNNYFVITDSLGSIAANAAKTVPINYDMQVMYGENSSTYYTVVKSTNTGCSDPKYESISLALADTSINPYARNSDGSVNGAAATQAVGADEEYDTTVTFKVGSDLYFGNPSSTCENMAVVEYDRTYILRVEGDTPKAYPGQFVYNNVSYDGKAEFVIPKAADGAEASFDLTFVSTGTQPDGTNDPIVHFYDCDIDKNEDTLTLIEEVADEDSNSLSLAAQSLVVYMS